MLFPKPIMLYLEQQKKQTTRSSQGFHHLVEEVTFKNNLCIFKNKI
jgi:hypothetical protein